MVMMTRMNTENVHLFRTQISPFGRSGVIKNRSVFLCGSGFGSVSEAANRSVKSLQLMLLFWIRATPQAADHVLPISLHRTHRFFILMLKDPNVPLFLDIS